MGVVVGRMPCLDGIVRPGRIWCKGTTGNGPTTEKDSTFVLLIAMRTATQTIIRKTKDDGDTKNDGGMEAFMDVNGQERINEKNKVTF